MDKMGQPHWKTMWQVLIKLSTHLSLTQQLHSQVFTQEKWKRVHKKRKTYKHVLHSLYFIMTINRRMGKQTMVYSYNGIVFSNKKEWVTNIHKNMGESQKHVKQKKPDRKEYILYEVQEHILLMHVGRNKEVVAWEEGQCSSVQLLSRVWLSVSPWTCRHARPPCPSSTPGAYPNSCPSRQWCHPAISSSVVPFSSCLQSFPASGSFPMSQFFTSGGQSIGVSALASVLPMNIQDWFPLGLTGWISLQSKRLSRVFSNPTVQKHQSSVLTFLYGPTLTSIHDYWKNHSLDLDLCWQSNVSAF